MRVGSAVIALVVLSLCAARFVWGDPSVAIVASTQGLESALAKSLQEVLRTSGESAVDGLTTSTDEGKSPAIRVSIKFEGSAAASRPYSSTASGELVLKKSVTDPGSKTGRAGLQHYYFSRFSCTGRLVFAVEKLDGTSYKKIDGWTRVLRPLSEEKMLDSVVVEQTGDAKTTSPKPEAYREAAATQLSNWLSLQIEPGVAEALKQRWLVCELINAQSDGRNARIRLKVSNRSPWPLKTATIAIVADPGKQALGSLEGLGVLMIAHLRGESIKPGEFKTLTYDDAVELAGPNFQGAGPPSLPRNFRAIIQNTTWQED